MDADVKLLLQPYMADGASTLLYEQFLADWATGLMVFRGRRGVAPEQTLLILNSLQLTDVANIISQSDRCRCGCRNLDASLDSRCARICCPASYV